MASESQLRLASTALLLRLCRCSSFLQRRATWASVVSLWGLEDLTWVSVDGCSLPRDAMTTCSCACRHVGHSWRYTHQHFWQSFRSQRKQNHGDLPSSGVLASFCKQKALPGAQNYAKQCQNLKSSPKGYYFTYYWGPGRSQASNLKLCMSLWTQSTGCGLGGHCVYDSRVISGWRVEFLWHNILSSGQ